MSFGGSWDKMNEKGGSGDGGDGDYGPRRLWTPEGTTKRYLFIDEDPFVFWEHNMYPVNGTGDKFTCPKKAKMGQCAACDADFWPTMKGYVTVIDMGTVEFVRGETRLSGYEANNGTVYQFGKGLLGFGKGSNDKPGVLVKLHRKAQQKCDGNLRFSVWDFTRSGQKTEACGDDFEFVTQLRNEAEAIKYLVSFGAKDDIDLKPVNREEFFMPKSEQSIARLIGNARNDKKGDKKGSKSDDRGGWGNQGSRGNDRDSRDTRSSNGDRGNERGNDRGGSNRDSRGGGSEGRNHGRSDDDRRPSNTDGHDEFIDDAIPF